MNNTDDQLINKFMQANKHEVTDNGFSRRVMRRLPMRAKVVSDVLTCIGIIVSCVLFIVFDGASLIYDAVAPVFQQSSARLIENLNFQTLIPLVVVMTYLGIQKAIALSES